MKEFAQFRLDPVNQCLWRRIEWGNDERILLTPKAFAVLQYLVEHPGHLVARDELIAAVWPDATVEPGVLDNQILNIRNALGDSPKSPAFIETLPRRGYRFIAPVSDGSVEMTPGNGALSGKLIGRDKALDELRESLEKAFNYQHQIVFITGEAGIGKTALADEFQRRAAEAPAIRIARGQCVEGYGGKEAYYPMLEALGQLCRSPGGESVIRTLASQAPTWLVQFPAFIKREHREMLQREILGATRERMLREIGDALAAIASSSPLLIVIEDLRWSDASTVDLISALARRREPAKLMILGTYGPPGAEWDNHRLEALADDLLVHRLCREVALGPLTQAEITEYLTQEAPGAAPPEELAALLYRRSEGNPLFMVAALEHLVERGLISREHRAWHLRARLEEIDLGVPEGLRRMIEAQIERLSAEEQRVLEAASLLTVGRPGFSMAARSVTAEMDPEAFEEVCERLSRRHSIVRAVGPTQFPDGTVSARYEFVHALYREVCYRRIGPGRRAQLHRRLGEWMEEHWKPAINLAATFLADHFEQGGDWLRSIKYLRLAADTALRRSEPRLAAEILEHARTLVSNLPEAERTLIEIEILQELAAIYTMLTDEVHALEAYEALVARAAQQGMTDLEVNALIDMAWPLSWTSSRRSLEVLERALRLSPRQEDPLLRARTRASCFALRLWQEWNAQDAEEFRDAFQEILNADDRRILAPYLADSGFVSWISSEYGEARRSLIQSRVILPDTVGKNPYLSSYSYLVGQCVILPMNLLFLGDWAGALREIRDSMAMLDKNADYHWGQTVRLCQALVHLQAMDFHGALAICNSALPLVRDPAPRPAPDYPTPYPLQLRMCLVQTGMAETALGNYDAALEYLTAAAADRDRPPAVWDWWWRMPIESALTELWLAKGETVQAQPQAERFLGITMAAEERTYQGLAWEANARVAMAAQDWERAEECVAKALSTIEGYEIPLAAWRVHMTAADLYARSGKGDSPEHPAAQHHRELSRATILKLANSLLDEPLRRVFVSAPTVRKILDAAESERAQT
jgi:DNA-binding winged helix-turn-helix (wHTH) protein/tetratricopeptide (TPR) repeat protein